MKLINPVLSLLIFLTGGAAYAQVQQFAAPGDFKLENAETIKDCRIGYRTFGKLVAERSNAILVAIRAGGTTEQLKSSVAAGG